jgi:hypothetical protein
VFRERLNSDERRKDSEEVKNVTVINKESKQDKTDTVVDKAKIVENSEASDNSHNLKIKLYDAISEDREKLIKYNRFCNLNQYFSQN